MRRKWLSQAQRTPIAPLYAQSPLKLKTPFLSQDFLVVDCEMSGLDAKKSELLSIGWVRIHQGKIDYNSRKHVLIHSSETVGDSIRIHGLCDQQLAGASSVSKVLGLLASHIQGAVLVFHHAYLDIAFIQCASMQSFACPMFFPYADTLLIEQQRLERQGKTGALQLVECRERYSLPAAFQHNAMFDAIATAELFLAQYAYMKGKTDITLETLKVNLST